MSQKYVTDTPLPVQTYTALDRAHNEMSVKGVERQMQKQPGNGAEHIYATMKKRFDKLGAEVLTTRPRPVVFRDGAPAEAIDDVVLGKIRGDVDAPLHIKTRDDAERAGIHPSWASGMEELAQRDRDLNAELRVLKRTKKAIEEYEKWVGDRGLVQIEAQTASAYKQLAESLARNDFLICVNDPKTDKRSSAPSGFVKAESAGPGLVNHERMVYLVGHDWASAFKDAQDYDNGEWRMPSDSSAFEFKISGRRFIVLMEAVDGVPSAVSVFTPTGYGWLMLMASSRGKWESAMADWSLMKHIRAICIGLDAEVIVSTPERIPHKSNREPKAAVMAVKHDSFHTLSLSRRTRVAALPRSGNDPDRHVRLHFRRGHWRHYPTWKTWIKWTLCGDPDLGFVDKQYRL